MRFSGAAESLYLRQISTKGTSAPSFLHGYRKHPYRPGVISKFSLRRAIKDKSFDADRFLYNTAPAAVFNWPIEIDFKLAKGVAPLFEDLEWDLLSRTGGTIDPSFSTPDMVPAVFETYTSGALTLRIILSPLGYELARSVSFSAQVSPKPYLTLTFQITVGELCLNKAPLDRTCTCTSFLTHPIEEDCTHDVFYRGVWVEFDESLIFMPPNGPVPRHPFLRDVRASKHPRITRYSELTEESQNLFQNLLLCLQTFGLWEHFNLIEDFLVDAGFPSDVARELVLDEDESLVEYTQT